jgi:hypothetical protein
MSGAHLYGLDSPRHSSHDSTTATSITNHMPSPTHSAQSVPTTISMPTVSLIEPIAESTSATSLPSMDATEHRTPRVSITPEPLNSAQLKRSLLLSDILAPSTTPTERASFAVRGSSPSLYGNTAKPFGRCMLTTAFLHVCGVSSLCLCSLNSSCSNNFRAHY